MPEFFESTAGRAVLGVVITIVVILLIELNYRLFMKAVLDVLFAFIAVIICSPVLLAGAVISKLNAGRVLESKAYLGVKGKIIYLHSFAGIEKGIKNLPRLFDVLSGRLSFVGVKPMELADGALMDDEQMERFNARPGLVCHLVLKGDEELTYEDIFALDKRYAKKRELFTDVFIILKNLAYVIRGEGKSYLGQSRDKSYAQVLLERGSITQNDFERANEAAQEALKNN